MTMELLTQAIQMPDAGKTDASTQAIVKEADSIEITTADHYTLAGDLLQGIVALQGEVKKSWKETKELAHAAHKAALKEERAKLDPLVQAEAILKPKLLAWTKKLKKEEDDRLADARAKAKKDAEAAQLKKAEEVEDAGGTPEQVEQVLSKPVQTPPVVLAKVEAPKVDAIQSVRTTWKWRAIAPELVPDGYKKLDDSKIGKVVRAMKGETSIAGIEVYCEEAVAVRRS